MWIAPALAVAASLYVLRSGPLAFLAAAPVVLLWFACPIITWQISRPFSRRQARLTGSQMRFRGGVSRRTWAFFDTFVGPDDHWLPPDNYQESPARSVAHRTARELAGFLWAALHAVPAEAPERNAAAKKSRETVEAATRAKARPTNKAAFKF